MFCYEHYYIFVNVRKKSITCRTAASGNAMVWQASVEDVTLTYHNTLFVLLGPVDFYIIFQWIWLGE